MNYASNYTWQRAEARLAGKPLAYEMGFKRAMVGGTDLGNPFMPETLERRQWAEGWQAADTINEVERARGAR